MHQRELETNHGHPEIDPKTLGATAITREPSGIAHTTLARLDIGLFRYLCNLGTSRQQVCSTLCLTSAEYEYISRHLNTL
jgi:hypothetical protein